MLSSDGRTLRACQSSHQAIQNYDKSFRKKEKEREGHREEGRETEREREGKKERESSILSKP